MPTSSSKKSSIFSHGSLAQLGEHLPYKQRVIGSIPITSTIYKFHEVKFARRMGSLHLLRDAEVKKYFVINAGMAELADALDLGSSD